MASEDDLSKYFKGAHEVQECTEGQDETNLHVDKANCKKNPGHGNFIPINVFTVESFPYNYCDRKLYDCTKALADITVRIAVRFTSPNRPEFWPGTNDPYPLYNKRGRKGLHRGTGRIYEVTYKSHDGTCPCPECLKSATPSKVWWKVTVWTAKHVLFDDSEARQSTCRLWFDDDQSPVVLIYGWMGDNSVTDEDFNMFFCATHNAQIGEKLLQQVRQFDDESWSVRERYKSRRDVDKLAIIVSHPHGCSKQVSVGHWVIKQVMKVDKKQNVKKTRYTYTTCTCSGSSGALVFRPGYYSNHPHGGCNSGYNYSAVDIDPDE